MKGHFLSTSWGMDYQPCTRVKKRSSFLLRPFRRGTGAHTDVGALNCGLGCLEPQADILIPSSPTFSNSVALCLLRLVVDEDMWLLLEGTLGLHC